MHCPYCSSENSKVIDSRDADRGIRRRRECLSCSKRFTTYERVETAATLVVVKKDMRREALDKEKLSTGVRKALEKRPLPTGTLERIVEDVASSLHALGKAEVSSAAIGEMVMERLREIDHVAYIRYASVYRDFKDIEELRKELEALEGGPARPWLNLIAPQPPLIPEADLVGMEKGAPKRRRRVRSVGN